MSPPYLFIDGNKIYLIVAQRCIEVPSPVELSTRYYRCNGFIIYRGLLQNVLRGELLVDISRFAGETWEIAGKDFQQFFSGHARNTNSITAKRAEFMQFKQFKPQEYNKKRNYKNKQNMVSDIEREVFTIEREVLDIEREVFDIEREVFDIEREVLNIEREVFMSEVYGRNVTEFEFIS
ncbi:uncharacterized protein OCT59_008686 [Rhizophagus irregularis]|uniref:MATA-HMG n=2 Tax=Rhizophagus irregularis TaxID=588596 RepID=U9TI20_RHIID|nr:hypothetical protein GLOIN_2v1484948 [Rhizophagus irregularis DAOM 181602=DAOM 197198]EXX71405.1 hypothetical protein RirG_078750 [Rhizophagus irregularis DAOM 197198w]POG63084.1 hypothetical protein GLOIN_2v1484948 [Rhizophagus irregularis DAOM 181602=DAOM 197198]UZO17328.1 hypothetical protein OCT59_008686 [Rhizophagus irregularis]GBC29544.1 hypothetical protein GLOIN_2v1484948 [Rhizophagus irregularis DAOM 181602=DAOM 197198]|eukprot:XP_025169950.1 hypothetical protein GLOIN_2v1484948 [Rhizophagus irregularis DAOM 181602=DAOM 197198]